MSNPFHKVPETLSIDVTRSWPGFDLSVAAEVPLEGVTALFGPSGSGKSTLLRIIAGLDRQAQGRVCCGGETWQDGRHLRPAHLRGVGYVFQDARLFPHLTVAGNLAYAAHRARGLSGPTVAEVVAALDLAPLMTRRTAALSGGERQRVAICRALLTAPKVLLMDEPLAALDDARKAEILPYLERLTAVSRVPIVYVSHSVAEVARLAHRIVVLKAGRVALSGSAVDLLSDPEAVALIGRRDAGSILSARMVRQHEDGLSELVTEAGPLFLPRMEARPDDLVRLRIPAHDILLARVRPEGLSALNILAATVLVIKMTEGPGALVQLAIGSERVLARITRRSALALDLKPGVEVYAIIKSVAIARGDVGGATAPRVL